MQDVSRVVDLYVVYITVLLLLLVYVDRQIGAWQAIDMSKPYSVTQQSSLSSSGCDPQRTGDDFDTIVEAEAAFNDPAFLGRHTTDTAYVMLDGPDVNRVRANPSFKPSRDDDSEWRSEYAMQTGMAFGCDGYNDAMGY